MYLDLLFILVYPTNLLQVVLGCAPLHHLVLGYLSHVTPCPLSQSVLELQRISPVLFLQPGACFLIFFPGKKCLSLLEPLSFC